MALGVISASGLHGFAVFCCRVHAHICREAKLKRRPLLVKKLTDFWILAFLLAME